jgi:hypothetical protein
VFLSVTKGHRKMPEVPCSLPHPAAARPVTRSDTSHVPDLTDQQRRDAFEKSLYVRQARARIKASIAQQGTLAVMEGWNDSVMGGMKVAQVLCALKGIGPIRARDILLVCKIRTNASVRSVGPVQKALLFRQLELR